jgi:hypothetical protein
MLTSGKNQNSRKLQSNFGFVLAMNAPQGIRASVILNLHSTFMLTSEKNKNTRKSHRNFGFWLAMNSP